METRISSQNRGRIAVTAVLSALLAAILACAGGGGQSISPDDPRLQPPVINTGLNLEDFLAQVKLFPSDLIPIPWIVTPKSPAQFTTLLNTTGWGPSRQDRPWPGDSTRSPVVKIYQLSPTGCDSEASRELVATVEVTDSRNWGTSVPISQAPAIIAATASVGDKESGLSNKIVMGVSEVKPIIDSVLPNGELNETISFTGTGLPGYCVILVRDGELRRFHSATIGQNGHWTLADVPHGVNSNYTYQVRLVELGSDSDPITVSEVECGIALVWQLPLDGEWSPSQDFDVWNSTWPGIHLGQDILRDTEAPVYAAASGCVRFARKVGKFGNVVIIEHQLRDGTSFVSLYGHLRQRELVAQDTLVSKGDTIGYLSSDSDDNNGRIHLHFGIREGPYKEGYLVLACNFYNWLYRGYGCDDGELSPSHWRKGDDFVELYSR